MALDGGFLYNLIAELNKTAVGTRVDKVHQPSRDEVVLQLRAPGFSGKLLLSARQGSARLGFIEKAPENPKVAPMFCMLLRKYLGGAKLLSVTQPEFERVAIFKFQARNEMGDIITPSLAVELISANPNIIFIDTDGRIVDSVRRSDIEKNTRIIAPGAKYLLPPKQQKLSPFSDFTEINAVITAMGDRKISEAVMSALDGVSPLISRELCLQCCRDIDMPVSAVSTKQMRWIVEKLQQALQNGKPYMIFNANGEGHEFSYMPLLQYGKDYKSIAFKSFSELLDSFYSTRDIAERIRRSSQDLLKLLSNLSSRITRKIAAQKSDLKRCESKEKHRVYGELLKANIYKVNKGDDSVRVINYYSENGEEIEIPLNSALSPADNAQKYFKDYKKLCVSERTLARLIEQSEQELKYIDSVFDALSRAESLQDIALIRDELSEGGYIRRTGNKPIKTKESAPNEYVTDDGFVVLSGKNNIQNDKLTTKIADKRDLWFHTKNIHGSHVILRLGGKAATELSIKQAAEIAAYNSKAKDSSSVPVDYTEVRNVKKPSGAKPGMVIYTTNNTVYVTPNTNEINRLKGGNT